MHTAKAILRKTCRQIRNDIPEAQREPAGSAILTAIRNLPEYQAATAICAYMSIGSEVPTGGLLQQIWQDNKQLLLPRVTSTDGIMEMVTVESNSPMTTGAFGIQEPDIKLPAARHQSFDLVIVPALAYDRQGFRLGYGGGYYDRFLATLPLSTLTIGLCYQCMLLDEVPRNRYDQAVAVVITETQVLRIR